jgi:hypothetical protein
MKNNSKEALEKIFAYSMFLTVLFKVSKWWK